MLLQPAEHLLIVAGLNLLRPEPIIIIVTTESRNANADRILSTTDDTIRALWVILEAEYQLSQRLWVHVRQLVGPYFLDHIARAGAQSTTLTNVESRFQRDGDCPSWCQARHIGLVNPCTSQIQTRRNLRLTLLQVRRRTCLQSLLRHTFQDDIFHAPLFADTPFVVVATIAVDHQNVGLHNVQRRQEIKDATALIDVGILHIADALHHEQSLLFGVDGLVVLIALDGLVGAYANIQITILSSLSEELHMSAVQQVVTP